MPETVFRSKHPSVIAAVEEADRQREGFSAAVKSFREEFPFLADDNKTPLRVWRDARQTKVCGFGWPRSETPPEGWRASDRSGVNIIVPARQTKAGKELHARLMGLHHDMPSKLWPGMPMEFFPALDVDRRPGFEEYGHKLFSPGYRMMGSYWWVAWGCRLPLDMVDLDIWEHVPLSTYYLAVEAAEAGEPANA